MSVSPHPTKNRHLPEGYTGPRWWYLSSYPDGRRGGRVNIAFYGTEAEARAADLEDRRQARKTPLAVNAQFEQCIPEFTAWYALEAMPGTVATMALHLRHLCRVLGKLPLTAITPAQVEHYKRVRAGEGVKPITVNKELNGLSVLLRWAQENNLIGEFQRPKLYPGKMTRSPLPVMPLASEFEAIVNEVRADVRGIVMLEFYAGLRRSESHNITAENVLLERGLIIIKGKGGKQRIVPIRHPPLLEELARKIDEVKTGYLWINPTTKKPYRRIDDALKAAAMRAGVNVRVYHHLCRHGFATTCIEDGVDLSSVSLVLGHSTTRTTEIYTHLAATHIIEQMAKFRAKRDPEEK